MGNCSGFCMSNNADEQPKKVTSDKVKSGMVEKGEYQMDSGRNNDYS